MRTSCARTILSIAFVALVTLAACSPRSSQLSFDKPEDALAKLVDAARRDDVDGLKALFGPGSEPIVSSGDSVADSRARSEFVQRYTEKHELVSDAPDHMTIQIGADGWPLPVPLVLRDGKWLFDGAAGAEEIVIRRIGYNELGAIAVCHGYVDAQLEYASEDRDGEGAGIYAQKLLSDPGLRNGLYWKTAEGEPPSPVGPFVALAAAEGYQARGGATPYHGYRYRPLYRQSANANGGEIDYFQNGVLVNGFALVAWPAEYGVSGVMTFIVNQDGVVFQRDLGEDTTALVEQIDTFDPDSNWVAIIDEETGMSADSADAAAGSNADATAAS